MIIALCVLLWWLSAFIPLLWMGEPNWHQWTPKDLLVFIVLGLMGPLLGLIVVGAVLSELDWWNQPIFGRREDDD